MGICFLHSQGRVSPYPGGGRLTARFSCITITANRPKSVTTHVIGISSSSRKQVKLIPAQQGGALKYCVLILKCEGADQETPAIEKIFHHSSQEEGACMPPARAT